MNFFEHSLVKLYIPLVIWVGLGVGLGYRLPKQVPMVLGRGLFWLGVPFSIMTFLRQANLSGSVWIAPLSAWGAILLGGGLAWLWAQRDPQGIWTQPMRGSFMLAAMVGNTGYLGYPVMLALVGPKYFAYALLYDTLGSTLGAYGLGVALAARYGKSQATLWQSVKAMVINPGLWGFGAGILLRPVVLPTSVEAGLRGCAWVVIGLSLLLLGMRLSQLTSWQKLPPAGISLAIKMVVVPLLLGWGLKLLGVSGSPLLVIVLQMGMPPAFATLVIAEAYQLDRELTVTALALGSGGILVMLPIWVWLFGG